MKKVIFVLLINLSILLTGCTNLAQKKESHINYKQRSVYLVNQVNWKLQGRIGFSGENQRGSANLIWTQAKDSYNMKIIAPVGSKKVLIKGDNNHINIRSSNGESVNSDNPTKAIYDNLGWLFPIDNLPFWIKGIPNPNQESKWLEPEKNKYSFSQAKWTVSFSLSDKENQNSLPELIIIENKESKVKVSVNKWDIK